MTTQLPGLAQQHDHGTEFYDRWLDADGHIQHRFTHAVTNHGETLRRRPPAEAWRAYLMWRAKQERIDQGHAQHR